MRRRLMILAVIPVMLMVNQCIIEVYSSGCVEGIVVDAIDGYPLCGVCVRVYSPPRCSDCGYSRGPVLIAECFTDCEGRFAFEIPWDDDYYDVVLTKRGYFHAQITLCCECDQFVEIALEPVMGPPYVTTTTNREGREDDRDS